MLCLGSDFQRAEEWFLDWVAGRKLKREVLKMDEIKKRNRDRSRERNRVRRQNRFNFVISFFIRGLYESE